MSSSGLTLNTFEKQTIFFSACFKSLRFHVDARLLTLLYLDLIRRIS